ncbi:Clr5 domain-containing protein [Dactylonectria estremocensis]|uniref:Clr5 domain-containing protein n=1 Tax=Dactylonectria estremocensis TaxID=1079267 RepID=A0A9P9JEA9_9HYPO|nr:Clr5 domain-containing protein [Dactylonectria estremocensis]
MAALPVLAPRLPGCPPVVDDRSYTKEHTEEEWESMRGLIKTLYIRDNRKLNETMSILQARHGFAATEQMFKKRLKKWNLRKRTYRRSPSEPTTSTPATQAVESRGVSPTDGDCVLENQIPDQTTDHTSAFMDLVRPSNTGQYTNLELVLGNVFSWSQAKLDSHSVASDPMSKYLANPNHPPIQDSRTMYRTFELVFDLWFHGKGDLAGMAARRGFFVLEYVLTDDHPDLVWHFLDTIYDMVDRGHLQLLSMFLDHATVLAQRQLPAQHPLVRILQQLRNCDYQTDQGRKFVCHLLRLAWLRNVDMLAEHIPSSGTQRLWLYEQLIWDGRTRLRKGSDLAKRREAMNKALEAMSESDEVVAAEDESDMLRIEALRLEFTQMDLGDKKKAEQLAISLLNRTSSSESSRSSDRFHAYARKMLARVHQDRQEWDVAEENLRCAVRKREAAHGTNNNLRVIRDLWVLAAHFQKAGRQEDAEATTADALLRAQKYLEGGL